MNINILNMKTQPVMSPVDVAVLVKLCLLKEEKSQIQLAYDLGISQSEVSKSMARSRYAGLLTSDKSLIMRQNFYEFLIYGVRYAFPQQPGKVVRGIPTSHSASPLSEHIVSNEAYVWPSPLGTLRGHSILPLYPKAIDAALRDQELYEALALIDALRVGKARERSFAMEELKKRLC
jgi:hypothetical protein